MLNELIARVFRFKERRTNLATEINAGFTTFITMSYIIFVTPDVLSKTGMPFGALTVSTCLTAAITTICMGFFANYPIALATGMGMNSFFAFSMVLGMNMPWEQALAAVFISGTLFVLLTLTRARTEVLRAIPDSLKYGIAAGIGLFIAFSGFIGGGIVIGDSVTVVTQASLRDNIPAMLCIFGLVVICAFESLNVRGAILIGIVTTMLLAVPLGVMELPESIIAMPPSIGPIFAKLDFSLASVNIHAPKVTDFWMAVFALLFMDFFDTVGTMVAISHSARLINEDGNMEQPQRVLLVDAMGTVFGSVMGVSTVTSYIESSSGVEAGGRTGVTAIVTGCLFIIAILFTPLISAVPSCATAPALIFVGVCMMMEISKIDLKDWTEILPAMTAVMVIPFTFSITNGIVLSVITYVGVKLATGRAMEVHPIIWCVAVISLAKEFLL